MSVISIDPLVVALLTMLSGISVFWQISLSCAEINRYTDKKGIICITDDLHAIPHKYRSTMKVVGEDKVGSAGKGESNAYITGPAF
jgi:hypothetical protein